MAGNHNKNGNDQTSLKGTFVSVLMLGAFLLVAWLGAFFLFLDRN